MLRELYQIDGFVTATDRDYDSVRQAFADAGIPIKEALQKNSRDHSRDPRPRPYSYNGAVPVLRGVISRSNRENLSASSVYPARVSRRLLRSINRLIEVGAGEIWCRAALFGGERDGALIDIFKLDAGALRHVRRRIGMIFQQFNIVKRLSVIDNVLSGGLGYQPALAQYAEDFFPGGTLPRARQLEARRVARARLQARRRTERRRTAARRHRADFDAAAGDYSRR